MAVGGRPDGFGGRAINDQDGRILRLSREAGMNGPDYLKHVSGDLVNRKPLFLKKTLPKKKMASRNRKIAAAKLAKRLLDRLDGK